MVKNNNPTIDKVGKDEYQGLPGKVWECDNDWCAKDKEVVMPEGHVFGGNVVNSVTAYVCNGDNWVKRVGTCGEAFITFKGNQKPEHDEYLYETEAAYKQATTLVENGGGVISGGKVWECDNDTHCVKGKTVTMPAGHVFKGKKVAGGAIYKCGGSGGQWNLISQEETCTFRGHTFNVGTWLMDSATNAKMTVNYNECSQFEDGDPKDENSKFNVYCKSNNVLLCKTADEKPVVNSCKTTKCAGITDSAQKIKCEACCEADQNTVKWTDGTCVCNDKSKVFNAASRSCVAPQPVKKKCRDLRKTDNGIACCDLAKEVAVYEEATDTCRCTNDNREFSIVNGKGSCKTKSTVVINKCDPEVVQNINIWMTQCVNNTQSFNLVLQLQQFCAKFTTKEDYDILYQLVVEAVSSCQDDNNVLIDDRDNVVVIDPVIPVDPVVDPYVDPVVDERPAINAAVESLDTTIADLKVTAWRNAEGKFNTARLASDSIAAVVLGTAGGLITSSVMKKHQVEDGFEDLKCTVGGQAVAGWGDEFTVGIK